MSSPDISNLPPDLQAIIRQAVADALKAAAPPPPRELTPAERADVLLATIGQLERGDKSLASGSGPTHQAILDLLAVLVKAVFAPKDDSSNAPPAGSAPVETTGV